MPPARLSRVGLAVVFIGLVGFCLLFLDSSPLSDTPVKLNEPADGSKLIIQPPENITIPAPTPWCKPDECTTGRWLPRDPPFTTIAQFQAAYANRLDRLWKGCHAIPTTKPRTAEELDKANEDRLMKVMNWTWTPYSGQMRPWNADEFMIRLMRSPGGLILIGDSITQQHMHSLGYLLNQGDIQFDARQPHLPMHDHKNVHQLTLKPNVPKTLELLRRSGVPPSRLSRPVVTMLEDHLLIGEPEIRAITERLGASPTYHWYHDFQRVEGWEEFVKNAAAPREGEAKSVTEDTVLMMNAGAHWSRHEFAMLPPRRTDKDEQARVKETYKQMMKLITGRMAPIPQLSVYYRSTSPGHPACERRATPYENGPSAEHAEQNVVGRLQALVDTDDLKKQRRRWDWDLFPVHNQIWKWTIRRLNRERAWRETRIAQGEVPGARWFYMDLWSQAVQRPDAHSEPGVDCLHWCLPTLLNNWSFHLHHSLFLESLPPTES